MSTYSLLEIQSQDYSGITATSGNNALLIYDIDTTDSKIGTFSLLQTRYLPNSGIFSSVILEKQPKVTDYRTLLSGKDLILISSHGGVYDAVKPSILLTETVTDPKMSSYSSDLQANRRGIYYYPYEVIHLGPCTFALLPSFFEYYYSGNRLNGAYVHLGICSGFGNNGNVNNLLASKLTSAGASVFTGYHKDVNVPNYDQYMSRAIALDIANNGTSVQNAVNSAKHLDRDFGPSGEYILVYGNRGGTH